MRRHFARGLEPAPDLRFSEEALLREPRGYALLYRRSDGNRVVDAVELGVADGPSLRTGDRTATGPPPYREASCASVRRPRPR